MFRRLHRHRRPLIAATLLIGAIAGTYLWHHRIPDVTSALGPPPEVFHDPRLDTKLTITFNGVKFVDAVTQIAERAHVPLHVGPLGEDKVRVFLHAEKLPARVVLAHVLNAAPLVVMVERVDGLHVMWSYRLDEKPIVRHVNIQPMLDIIDRRNTEPGPGPFRRTWASTLVGPRMNRASSPLPRGPGWMVKASPDVQNRVAAFLAELRRKAK
ncbi:MAG: hypothetical protein WC058_10715 [Phycisphaeraceae bacterium]